MGEKFIMKLSTYIKSNSIKTISILVLCLTLFVVLFGVGCSAKKMVILRYKQLLLILNEDMTNLSEKI